MQACFSKGLLRDGYFDVFSFKILQRNETRILPVFSELIANVRVLIAVVIVKTCNNVPNRLFMEQIDSNCAFIFEVTISKAERD